MRLLAATAAAAAVCMFAASMAHAGKQAIALFPPENLSGAAIARYVPLITSALAEKLSDRFDVQTAAPERPADPAVLRKRARSLGATYVVTGSVSRIGKAVTLDIGIAPTEDPGRGRVVVVSGTDTGAQGDGDLPFVYRKLVIEAAAKLKYLFFGDEIVGEGPARRMIPKPAGAVVRSRPVPGEMISAAYGDTDGDGKSEVVAAYADSIVVYSVTGDDLVEKARIPGAGSGYIHVDVADINRNGFAEIIATRYQDGKVASDVFESDGKVYRPIAAGLPYFLRAVALGSEGTVLLGQEADPATVFAGPVFRIALDRYGMAERKERDTPLPLPPGTWIYEFVPVRRGPVLRYAALGATGRLKLLDGEGKTLWESLDSVSGAETSVEAAISPPGAPPAERDKRRLPPRLFAVDLDGDGVDEVVVLNNLATGGWFFEGLLIYSNAEALAFVQDEDSLRLAWRTPQIGGSAGDAFLETTSGGKLARIGIASRRSGRLLSGLGEWSVLWLR